ncbi:MAG: right-handed parallel beta-helix repeat-containing protein [Polyangiaceae bacterium]
MLLLAALLAACVVTDPDDPGSGGGGQGGDGGGTSTGGSTPIPPTPGDWGAHAIDDGGCGPTTGSGEDEAALPCDGASVLCVAASAAPGGDGTATAPFASIGAAVAVANDGATVQVAAGTYGENVVVQGKVVLLRGGFDPTFTTRNSRTQATCIDGGGQDSVIALLEAGSSEVDGFQIRGGAGFSGDPFYEGGGGIYVDGGNPTLAHNVIENNSLSDAAESTGGGIRVINGGATITRNHIRHNVAALGGGVAASEGTVVLDHNTVSDNDGLGDHGAGLYLAGNVTVAGNLVSGNETGQVAGYGWGGGMVVFGEGTVAQISGNFFTGNRAPQLGGAIYIDDGAVATLTGDLVVGNHTDGDGSRPCGAAIYVDGTAEGVGSTATFINATIADNDCDQPNEGSAIFVEAGSSLVLRNSILWGHANADEIAVDGTSSMTASYCLGASLLSGTGNLSEDPLFVGAGDYHLQATSPGVDAGDPSDAFDREPEPNGGRINLGAFGNTDQATTTP